MSISVADVKQKILNYISSRGPSLPVHLTKATEMNLTFTSAILSELLSERKLKLSNLRVGASPLYYIPGQEEKLESFISNLKEPEIEAFNKLKQNKILDDEKQSPVMRVALRAIRDFAVPIKHKEKVYWKYHLLSDDKASLAISEKDEPLQAIGGERVLGQQIWEDIKKQQLSRENVEELVRKQVEEIAKKMKEETIEKKQEEKVIEVRQEIRGVIPESSYGKDVKEEPKFNDIGIKKEQVKKVSKKNKKTSPKELFLEESKQKIASMGFNISEILFNNLNKIIAEVNKDKDYLIIFTKKKRIDNKELLKDLRKYNINGLDVEVYIGGEPSKKLTETIDILTKITGIRKIEEQ